ncbi:MAG: efflux RND transporter periplasmic adaptor subunit [Erythrobacter sp.]
MALNFKNLSFSRQILPVLAVIGIIVAGLYIFTDIPDRGTAQPQQQPPRPQGELADSARVAASGLVEPSSEIIDIGSALSGLVTDLRVQPGDRVERGQPLFTVDDRAVRSQLGEAEAQIGEARAAIAEAQAQRETAREQLQLYRNLSDPAAVSRSEIVRVEGDVEAASSRLASARARLELAQARAQTARTELGRLTVRAPITGEILAVNIRPGEYVSTQGGGNSEPFIQMGETNPLHVRVDVDENEAIRVEQGVPARVSPRGGAEIQVEAAFVRAEPLVVPKRQLTNTAAERVDVRVLQLIYALPNTAAAEVFRVGQQVDAFIPARRESPPPAAGTSAEE